MTGLGAIIFWLIAAIVFIVLEGITIQLVSIWFVIGTIPSIIAAALGGGPLLQGVLFIVTSLLVLLVGRPILHKKLAVKRKATNADRVIGMTGVVLESINNLKETGRVRANGLDWTARTRTDTTIIPADSHVEVLEIDGVKLIVDFKLSTAE